MPTDFFDTLLKEVSTSLDKLGYKVSEAFEITKIKTQIEEIVKDRNEKLIDLGVLTFKKIEDYDSVSQEELDRIIEEIKGINYKIEQKRAELIQIIKNSSTKLERTEPIIIKIKCVGCDKELTNKDKFCSNCGKPVEITGS